MANETGPARKQAGQVIYQAEKSLRDQGDSRAPQRPGQAVLSVQVARGTASRTMRT